MSKQRLGQAFVSAGSTTRGSSRSAADCIGRVGGLAAALGVGAMLFVAPWTAAAETEGASSSESSATSEPDSTESTDSLVGGAGAGDSDTSGSSDDDSDDDTDAESEADELDAEISEEIADELDEDPDDEGASSSGEDDAEAVDVEAVEVEAVEEAIVEEADHVVVHSGGSNVVVETDTAATDMLADEPETVIEDGPSEPIETTSAPLEFADTAVAEPASSRSYTSASVMAARTGSEEITEAPAKALQAQPGTFLEVASSMLSAVIAPFVTTPAAPAAPSAQPLMWGVLSWVRRELDDTFANFSISIGGRQLVQNGTAYATSEGFGSFAIAYGENSIASASGLFNVAIVRGDDSTATSEGNFTRVRVRGDDNTAGATGPGSRTTVYGDENTAEATGSYTSIYVRGVGNAVTTTGDGTRATVTGDDNDATAQATNGSRAQITVRGDQSTAVASAVNDSTARVRLIGDESTAVATAVEDGYAVTRVTGDTNVASSVAVGETAIARITGADSTASATATDARAEATTFGDGNAAQATDGKAVISGDGSTATADGPGSLARVWGDGSAANALGERNTAFVWGNESRAVAGPGIYNNALALGNNLLADTGPGDGRTVYGQPFDPENQTPVAGSPGEQTVDPQTGAVTGTLGFTDPDGDTLTYTVSADPANGSVTVNADGTYSYTPATRPAFGEEDGADAFTVTASDGQATAVATIDVPVTALPEPGNQAPQAGLSGPWQINEETGVVTATLGFTDPDGDPLTYEVTEQPNNGLVTVDNEAGTYTYTPETRPEPGQPDGEDSFTVVASDPDGLTATNTIGLPIVALPEPDNQAPVAGTPGEQTVNTETGSVTGSLGFTDPDGDDLTYTATDPANGSVTIDAQAGTFTYTPATRPEAGEPDGTDAFTVTATDPDGLSASTTIDVPVTALPDPENRAPVPGDLGQQSVDPETGAVTATFSFTDPDGDELTYTVSSPINGTGTVTLDAQTGTYTYTPDPEARPAFGEEDGVDAFTLTASDGQASSTIGVEVPVTALPEPDNQAPVAGTPGEQTVNPETGSVTGSLGFTDPDGDDLTYTATDPANGSVTIDAQAGTFTYTPDTRPEAGEPDGADAFTVTATDPDGLSAMTTINVPVVALPEPDNQAPVASNDVYTVSEDGTLSVTGPGVLGNDTDADGDGLQAAIGSDVTAGTLVLNPDGSFTYTPNAGFDGTDTFTYTASDGSAQSNVATVTINVQATQLDVPTLLGIAETAGSPTKTVVGPDGRVYVTITTGVIEGGGNPTDTWENSVYAIDPQNPTNLILIAESYDGPARGGLVFGPNNIAYQASYDDDTRTTTVRVIDLSDPDATPTVVEADGALAQVFNAESQEVLVDSAGNAYVVTALIVDDEWVTHVTVIPTDPTDVRRAEFAGEEARLAVSPTGGAYLAIQTGENQLNMATTVYAIDTADPTQSEVVLELDGTYEDGPAFDAAGNMYVTTSAIIFTPPITVEQHTYVGILKSDGSTHVTDLEGVFPRRGVVIGPDGNAYQAVESAQPGTIAILVFDAQDPTAPETIEIEGSEVLRTVVVGPGGGTVFVTTRETDENGDDVDRVVVIDRASGESVAVDLTGTVVYESSGGLVTDADGRGYITTSSRVDVDGDGIIDTVTHLAVIDPQSPATPLVVDVVGSPSAISEDPDVAVGPDGLVYLTTIPPTAPGTFVNATQVTVIDPGNPAAPIIATFDLDGAPIDGVVFDAAGRAHQATDVNDPDDPIYTEGTANIAVIGVDTHFL